MAERSMETMTPEAFLAWCLTREEAYELVDGVPRAMTGAKVKHDRIVRRALVRLSGLLAGGPCEPFTDDIAVVTPAGNVRRPDVVVDCGPTDEDDTKAAAPVLVLEVLSDRTSRFDLSRKTIEYKAIATVRHILLLDPDQPRAVLHSRSEDGSWSEQVLIGADTEIALPGIGVVLHVRDFYP